MCVIVPAAVRPGADDDRVLDVVVVRAQRKLYQLDQHAVPGRRAGRWQYIQVKARMRAVVPRGVAHDRVIQLKIVGIDGLFINIVENIALVRGLGGEPDAFFLQRDLAALVHGHEAVVGVKTVLRGLGVRGQKVRSGRQRGGNSRDQQERRQYGKHFFHGEAPPFILLYYHIRPAKASLNLLFS